MQIAEFDILTPLSGGLAIGASAVLMLWLLGRIAGISGIAFGIVSRLTSSSNDTTSSSANAEIAWRALFLLGLIVGAGVYHFVSSTAVPMNTADLPLLIVGGFLVGLGTKIGSGCTSGHGVVGIGRFSLRSIAATLTFMTLGILTVLIGRHVLGVL
jgi:hypothetical protein